VFQREIPRLTLDSKIKQLNTSEVLPGATRSFTNFSAANKEATLSRIFAGVHFRTDLTSAQRMGSEVADFVVDNFSTPVHERDDSEDNR
jgi:hypothetical protein